MRRINSVSRTITIRTDATSRPAAASASAMRSSTLSAISRARAPQPSRSSDPYDPCMPSSLTYRSSVYSTARSFHRTTVMVYHSHVSYPYGITRRIACQATFSKGVPSTCSQPHATSPAANEKGPNLSSTLHPLSNAQTPKLTRSGSPARPGQPESPAPRNQRTQWSHQAQRQPNQHQPQHPHQRQTPHR